MTCSPARLRPPICSPGLEPLPSVTRSIENYGGHLLQSIERSPLRALFQPKSAGCRLKSKRKSQRNIFTTNLTKRQTSV
jgi:hypothetical protein